MSKWYEWTFIYKVKGYESLHNQETIVGTTLEGAKDHLVKEFNQFYPNKEIVLDSIELISQV